MLDEIAYDGVTGEGLARLLDLPGVVVLASVPSTMDVAHALGAGGAPPGTLVLADAQTEGRGRGGRTWRSEAGAGVWMTLLERPADDRALAVLSLRLGLRAARVLDRYAAAPIGLKWPNDLYVGERKLAGILVEARWRSKRAEWVAIGFGLNVVAPPDVPTASGLRAGVRRTEVLAELVPALRGAAATRGHLSERELEEYASRDLAIGRACESPAVGRVEGITADGALRIVSGADRSVHRGGSLVLTVPGASR